MHVPGPFPAPLALSEPASPSPSGMAGEAPIASGDWWTALNDAAIDVLVPAALADNPTLSQAIARVDEAGAVLSSRAAQRMPLLQMDLGAARLRELDHETTPATSAATLGLALRWEIDLFGRVRNSVNEASHRLDARHADATAARLALTARVAHTVMALRGCRFAEAVLADDIASREVTLDLSEHHLAAGAMAAVDVHRARAGLAAARTAKAVRGQQCATYTNALVALTGRDAASVAALMAGPVESRTAAAQALPLYAQWIMPRAPSYQLRLPATMLARHPAVLAAEAELAAASSEIAVARAERLPRVDLGAALSGQWLRAPSESATGWSIGPALSVPLFDGGRGAANVAGSQARYRLATAALRGAVRDAALNVENALASSRSAHARLVTTRDAAEAAQATFDATEAMWRAGASSLFVLEDSRRQLASANNDAIAAVQDSSQAWVALVLACGGSPIIPESASQ